MNFQISEGSKFVKLCVDLLKIRVATVTGFIRLCWSCELLAPCSSFLVAIHRVVMKFCMSRTLHTQEMKCSTLGWAWEQIHQVAPPVTTAHVQFCAGLDGRNDAQTVDSYYQAPNHRYIRKTSAQIHQRISQLCNTDRKAYLSNYVENISS